MVLLLLLCGTKVVSVGSSQELHSGQGPSPAGAPELRFKIALCSLPLDLIWNSSS